MSWNFILLIFINVCRWIDHLLYSRLTYIHTADRDFSAVSEIIKRYTSCFVPITFLLTPDATQKKWTILFNVERFVACSDTLIINDYQKIILILFMFMVLHYQSHFSKIFPVLLKCDFSWFQPIIGRFYKMRVSWEFNIYNLLSPFINTVLSFSNTMWILSVAR